MASEATSDGSPDSEPDDYTSHWTAPAMVRRVGLDPTGGEVGGQAVISVDGELDLTAIDQLQRFVQQLLDEGEDDVVLDLRDMTVLDSVGISTLIRLHQAVSAQGSVLRVQNPAEPVRRVLDLTGVSRYLHVEPA
jgi:anti-anti-sigma factor